MVPLLTTARHQEPRKFFQMVLRLSRLYCFLLYLEQVPIEEFEEGSPQMTIIVSERPELISFRMFFLNSRNYVVNKAWLGTSFTSFGIGCNALNFFTQNPASDCLDYLTWTFHIFVSRTAHQVRWYHNHTTVTLLKALWIKSRNFCIENALGMNVFLPDHHNTVGCAFNKSVQSALKRGRRTSYLGLLLT